MEFTRGNLLELVLPASEVRSLLRVVQELQGAMHALQVRPCASFTRTAASRSTPALPALAAVPVACFER